MRKFEVQEGLMGYAVVIGCQMCFFSTKEELAAKVNEYILNPEETEQKYYNAPRVPCDPVPDGITRPEPTRYPSPIEAAASQTGLRRG